MYTGGKKLIDFDRYLDGMTERAWQQFTADKAPLAGVTEQRMRDLIREHLMRDSAKRAVLLITNAYADFGYDVGRAEMVAEYLVDAPTSDEAES